MATIGSAPGVDISFHLLGGTGPPVLFVHATGFCGSIWTPVTRRLGAAAECWVMDARAHGASPVAPGVTLDWDSAADDVLAVAEAISDHPHSSDEPLRGAGHSMGGALLLLAEARRPGTFGQLWVYEPIVFPPSLVSGDRSESPLAVGARRRRRIFTDRRAAFANYASKPPMQYFDPEALRSYVADGLVDCPEGVALACEPSAEAVNYESGGHHTGWSVLDEVRCPVTVASGDPSIPGPGSFAAAVADALPSARLEVERTWGHFAPMEHPAAVARRIADALGL